MASTVTPGATLHGHPCWSPANLFGQVCPCDGLVANMDFHWHTVKIDQNGLQFFIIILPGDATQHNEWQRSNDPNP